MSVERLQEKIRKLKNPSMVDLALAVQDCMAATASREEFCQTMEHEHGWNVTWKDTKKSTVVVLIAVVICATVICLLDLGLAEGILALIGLF